MIRSHGIKRSFNKHWEYDAIFSGLNLRLTEFQSALGISQLKKMKSLFKKKKYFFKICQRNKKIKQVLL